METFHKDLDDALELVKKSENTIVLGDFNAKIGRGSCLNIEGNYGLPNKNECGDRFVQFC